jgi:hypothetical protein
MNLALKLGMEYKDFQWKDVGGFCPTVTAIAFNPAVSEINGM